MSISNEILMTYSQQDQILKIWKLDEEGCTCQREVKLKNKATSFQYDADSKTLAVFDDKCHISVAQWDFENN